MKKHELVNAVWDELDYPRPSKRFVEASIDSMFTHIAKGLKPGRRLSDRKFSYRGFGALRVVKRPARRGTNPRTHEPLDIPAKLTVVFKPSRSFFYRY